MFAAACGTETPDNSNANKAAETNTAPAGTPYPAATPLAKENEAPTLTPVFKAYCEATVKKDIDGLKKIWSSDTLKAFEQDAKEQNVSINELMIDENVTLELCDVLNEKIEGDKASAYIRSGTYPNGIDVLFVKEDGEWKLTTISPSVLEKLNQK